MCDLQRFIKDLTDGILNFRLDLCCFVFSVRAGILLCGYFNIISNMICLIAVSTGVFPPLMMNAQQSFMEGEYIKSTCAFAYSTDLCLAVHLLCGMYRKDLVLLRYYTYCGMAMLASTILVYSMVIGILSVLHTCMLVISLTYQVYIILLVRSMMVELKQEQERFEYFYQNYPVYIKHDIEAPGDYPLETYEIYSPTSSRRNSEIIPTALNVPKSTENEQVKDTIELKTIESKVTEPQKNKVKDTEPKTSEVQDTTESKSSKPVEDQPTTSKTVMDEKSKTAAVQDTPKSKAMRYPYKFIAIKVPKEESIKEENEEKETDKVEVKKEVAKKEEIKETVKEEESKEVVKETNKKKRSIFGRKKSKSDDGKTKIVDKKT